MLIAMDRLTRVANKYSLESRSCFVAKGQRKPKQKFGAIIAAMGVAALTLTACTIGDSKNDSTASVEKTPTVDFTASVKDDQTKVSVLDPITVSVPQGHKLDDVKMVNEDGKEVKGALASDGTSWQSAEPLGYSRTYTLKATSGDETMKRSFTTVTPTSQTYGYVSPAEGSTVGVGQTIAIRFDEPIPDRQAAQDAIKIKTEPAVEGAFYWLNNSEVRWRPENFWEPGTKVNVKVDIYGKDLGEGYFGQEANETNFTIGDRVIARADDATKTMTVEKNGEIINSMPISMGSNRWPTPNGTYIIGDKNESMVMDSTTFGLSLDNGGYRTKVKYATQMSYSGIYVHAAPWSVWAQGSQNTSHGCINVTEANAAWFQKNVKRGDVVIVSNTIGGQFEGYDGLGDWQIPWETWKKGNAKTDNS